MGYLKVSPDKEPSIPGTAIHALAGEGRELIINTPSWQALHTRLAFGVITGHLWALWIYLWRPLVSLYAWYFGVDFAVDYLAVADGFAAFKQALPIYILIIVLTGGSLVIWGNINWVRFSGKERRKRPADVSPSEIAQQFSVPPDVHQQSIKCNRIAISYDQNGHIVDVSSKVVPPSQ